MCAFLVVGASACIQVSAALAKGLLDTVGTVGTSGVRMALAAALLLLMTRPGLKGRSRREWLGIALYGVAMAAMNVLFYNAVARLPLGIAVTLEYLGPFTVAVLGTRVRWQALFPVVGLVGVALISDPTGGMNVAGMAWALGAAVAFGGYTALAGFVGTVSTGLSGLALSVSVGALVLSPFSVFAAPRVPGAEGWVLVALSGAMGVALAFTLTYTATRLTSPRVTGTLLAVDPAMGALVGAVAFHESVTVPVGLGIGLVVLAGAAVTWLAGREPSPETREVPVPR